MEHGKVWETEGEWLVIILKNEDLADPAGDGMISPQGQHWPLPSGAHRSRGPVLMATPPSQIPSVLGGPAPSGEGHLMVLLTRRKSQNPLPEH